MMDYVRRCWVKNGKYVNKEITKNKMHDACINQSKIKFYFPNTKQYIFS